MSEHSDTQDKVSIAIRSYEKDFRSSILGTKRPPNKVIITKKVYDHLVKQGAVIQVQNPSYEPHNRDKLISAGEQQLDIYLPSELSQEEKSKLESFSEGMEIPVIFARTSFWGKKFTNLSAFNFKSSSEDMAQGL